MQNFVRQNFYKILQKTVYDLASTQPISEDIIAAVAASVAHCNSIVSIHSFDPFSDNHAVLVFRMQVILQQLVLRLVSGTLDLEFFKALTAEEALFAGLQLPIKGFHKAQDQFLSVEENTPIALALVATTASPDHQISTYSINDQPANGTLQGDPPNISYTPNPLFAGTDSFTFFVTDSAGDSNIATVSIDVTPLAAVEISQFQAFPVTIASGQSTTLSWQVANAIALTITDLKHF